MTVRREDHFAPHDFYLGIDVSKSFHWAMGLDPSGKIAAGRRVENRVSDVDALLEEAGDGALVVVDQKNNIGSLVVRRCRARGVDVGHVPGRTTGQARDMFPGTAKTDRTGAEAIARTALGMRRVVLPMAESDDLGASVSLPSSQLACATRRATMARNRLRAALLECGPAFEAAADLSSAWQLAAEDVLVRSLAAEVLAADSERSSIERDLAGRLSGGRGLPLPARRARHRPQDRDRARPRGGRVALRRRRQAGQLLRPGALGQPVRHVDRLLPQLAGRQQATQEPAHIQLQLARGHEEQVRQVLRRVRLQGHETQPGAEGGRPKEARCHIRHHARSRPLRGALTGHQCRELPSTRSEKVSLSP